MTTVRGRCPSCGTESLFLGAGGYVTCGVLNCKKPDAASDLLKLGWTLLIDARDVAERLHHASGIADIAARHVRTVLGDRSTASAPAGGAA